jgi:hypothetical protein
MTEPPSHRLRPEPRSFKGMPRDWKRDISIEKEIEAAKNSYYYWWFMFLRESDEYRRAETGSKKEPYASLFRDFGRIRNNSFEYWWQSRGRDVFSEPVAIPKVREMENMELASDEMPDDFLYIEIPLKIRKQTILRQINKLLDTKHGGRELNLLNVSKARRKLYAKQRIRITTFEPIMNVWTARKKSPDKSWWQIGSDLKLNRAYEASERDDENDIKHKQRMMTLIVQRLYRKAQALIKFAALGDFPRFK